MTMCSYCGRKIEGDKTFVICKHCGRFTPNGAESYRKNKKKRIKNG